ncbi:tripartite tricarboxylate transporter TctB family protein [Metabacillus herbersteinensis]|uniref:Tripartite tricarboxylate transporter TctB family protein n=1 Tax=Metabacillus herbersteinensis TaxID=283816 RepID=A0ABV6GIV0_9BACI
MRIPNIICGFIVMCIAGFFYAQSYQIKEVNVAEIGPIIMPRIYCGLLIVLGGIVVIQGLLDKSAKEERENTMGYAAASMGFVLLYILLIPFTGFYLSTVLLVAGLLFFSKVRNKILLISVPLGATLFIYIGFEKLLKVAIPIGSLFS